jgi:GNAT superfamily N-acetyltransferase
MEAGTALVPRIDGNLYELYECAALAAGKRCIRGNGYRHLSLRPSPWANVVFDLALESEASCAELAREVAEGRLPNKVSIGPTSLPPDIGARLLAAGFEKGDRSWGMVLDMARRQRSSVPEGLSFAPLAEADRFEAFASIVARNLFGAEPETAGAFAALLRVLDPAKAFGILGSFGGMPTSTAFAYIDGLGCGGIYFVATEAAFRGRGFGAATVSAILDELERRGVAGCILQATKLGKPVYERLGFEESCDLGRYVLPEGRGLSAKKGDD